VWLLERRGRRVAAVMVIAGGAALGTLYLKRSVMPAVDRAASARTLWQTIAGRRAEICVDALDRNWRYGLNYYSVTPLPECSVEMRPLSLRTLPGGAPLLDRAIVDPLSSKVVPSRFRKPE